MSRRSTALSVEDPVDIRPSSKGKLKTESKYSDHRIENIHTSPTQDFHSAFCSLGLDITHTHTRK